MSKLAIMQPYLFPYLGYFQLIHAVDTFIVYDELDYILQGWINRNRLLAVKGPPFYFIVPLSKKSTNTKIRNIRIRSGEWKATLLNSIHMNYRRSPYYDEVYQLVESVVMIETDSLSELNKAGLVRVSRFLGINTAIIVDARFEELENKLTRPVEELASLFSQFKLEEPSAKVIRAFEICKAFGSEILVNPIQGVGLYSREEFKRNQYNVKFLKMRDVRYRQVCAKRYHPQNFSPRLSIIDVLMNCGKKETVQLLGEFDIF